MAYKTFKFKVQDYLEAAWFDMERAKDLAYMAAVDCRAWNCTPYSIASMTFNKVSQTYTVVSADRNRKGLTQ